MSAKLRRVLLPLLVMQFAGLLLVPRAARAEESCTSAGCHAKLVAAKIVHPAAEACESCHESVSPEHPRAGEKTFKLTQDVPALCSTCHEIPGKKSKVHFPVQEGMCASCHDPHSSDQAKLLTQPLKELCTTCHADQIDHKVPHGPAAAGDCGSCHVPHESDAAGLLVKPAPELCFGCHVDMESAIKKPHVHGALDAGCVSCHAPHGSAYPKLLSAGTTELCFQCHGPIEEAVRKASVAHPPVEAGCASCHAPHASDHAKLLSKPEKDTCLECHGDVIPKGATVLHGPIEAGSCTPCHEPHGGSHPKLLSSEFPADAYVPYTDEAYPLCFTCHDRDQVRYPDTSFATGFRDGDRNLHHLHVNNPRKGRSCKLCHEIHAGTDPRLVAESVPFGKWKLPIKFTGTETGGGCAPGCHQPFRYDRQNPVKKVEAPKR